MAMFEDAGRERSTVDRRALIWMTYGMRDVCKLVFFSMI